jgi:hypothetical protein
VGFGMLLVSLSLTANSLEVLKPFTAVFSVYRNIIPLGNLTLNFDLNSVGEYTYTAHTNPGMLAGIFQRDEVVEKSQGSLINNQIKSNHYSYRNIDDTSANTDVKFDWHKLNVNTKSHGVTWSQLISSGIQDKLSQQLQVRIHLAQGSESVSYQVADGGKLKTYQFQVDGEEVVETPYGELNCLRVKRRKESRPPDYTIWFAAKLNYLPVKIERTQGEELYRMVLDKLTHH